MTRYETIEQNAYDVPASLTVGSSLYTLAVRFVMSGGRSVDWVALLVHC
jgi:hypothetical protein